MPKYLIDANLPYYFSLWNNEDYIHLKDLNDEWNDEEIWKYAKHNNLTIVTKDSDFSNKVLYKEPPPKVIHLKIGNMRMREFHDTITAYWSIITMMNTQYKLVNVYKDRIEGID